MNVLIMITGQAPWRVIKSFSRTALLRAPGPVRR